MVNKLKSKEKRQAVPLRYGYIGLRKISTQKIFGFQP